MRRVENQKLNTVGEPYETLDKFRLTFEFLAALVGAIYFFRLKGYWKWFSVYLLFIFLQEVIWYKNATFIGILKKDYFAYIGIPVQFIFFFWLYALKSLKKSKLFIGCLVVYLLTLCFPIYFEKSDWVYSFNYNVGTMLLMVLMVLEFIKQIKTENILKFRQNKMFYVNVGVILFYAGTYPFFVFQEDLLNQYRDIWNGYYIYFLIANCIMYLLFAASFIWGKERS